MKKKVITGIGSGRRVTRFTAFACVTMISSGLILGGCGGQGGPGGPAAGEESQQKEMSILVEAQIPSVENIELDGDFIGSVESEDAITVMVKVGGDVTGAFFE